MENAKQYELELNEENLDQPDIPDEPDMVEPFDPSKIKIQPKQDTLRNLIDRLKEDEIDLNTDFQRHGELWDHGKMSRLIESILIRFPLPAFYFDATNDDCWLVVDGLQRLSSIRKFVVEKDTTKCLRLSGLEYLKDLRGATYEDLSRTYKRRIAECPVTYFQILPGTPDEVKYSIFRRINTGGLTLTNQEIRNALAKDIQRNFLQKLAENPYLKKTMGDQTKRMMDQELVLRFLAFYYKDYTGSKKNIAEFLDEVMDDIEKYSETEKRSLEKAFADGIERSFNIFGDRAFEKRSDGEEDVKRKRKNTALFEVWTVSLAKLSDEDAAKLIERGERLNELHRTEMDPTKEYYRSISLATQKREHVRIRYSTVSKIIQEVLRD
ncbi:DUF262 domain-containing protein [Geobacter hydrogenophilus]|uniref:GmrSD restriction endonucleases N-terminal domain-containing protein n=1 Tax=Geobacter hydrogenophilus TaxID=40983 RepID=A0A9W6LC05_9BACT|nr:DUF262 domain-containing protein [Geobacter hydrogenophilus]MBT0895036.1 DUF262 domain-containing protein [Geobacter hydrogenophilus]GLI36991.1 hypothetical protein GHYDROH2_04920 [Geobacter hydrogenophilus]